MPANLCLFSLQLLSLPHSPSLLTLLRLASNPINTSYPDPILLVMIHIHELLSYLAFMAIHKRSIAPSPYRWCVVDEVRIAEVLGRKLW